jgi:hypothetical protein
MSTLAQDFNVGAVHDGHYRRMDVTLAWTSETPMEVRLHMWHGDEQQVIWSLSRDVLVEALEADAANGDRFGMADVRATRVRIAHRGEHMPGIDNVHLHLASDDGQIALTFKVEPLDAFIRSSLAMCPPESEALDVDGLITQIFKHAERTDS